MGGTAARGGVTQRAALLKAGLAHVLDSYQVSGLKAEDRKASVIELKHIVLLPSEPEKKATLIPNP